MADHQAIIQYARYVFEDPRKADRWLNKPKRQLDGLTPLEALEQPGGEKLIRDWLTHIEYYIST